VSCTIEGPPGGVAIGVAIGWTTVAAAWIGAGTVTAAAATLATCGTYAVPLSKMEPSDRGM
jgi:hypothetical protein